MTISHVLVPTDFSPYADQALAYAIELAPLLQARLTLLHAVHAVPLWVEGDMGRALPDVYLRELEAHARQELEQRQQRVREAGIQGNSMLVHGIPFQSIVDAAREQKIDLIVMGTHGRTGLQHVLLGSVAEKVVRLAPCAVLIVRRPHSAVSQ
jgi:nucleotide-binding universal stress UspA family protein